MAYPLQSTQTTPQPTPFRASLDRQRLSEAIGAATYARMAPLPKTDSASAFGSVDASKAARAAYQARQNVKSGGMLRQQDLEDQENARKDMVTSAGVGLTNANAGYINTLSGDITAMRPSRIAAIDAATGYQKGQTSLLGEQTNQMRAVNQFMPQMLNQQMKGGDLDLEERRNGLEMLRRYGPQMYQNQVAIGQNQVRAGHLQNEMYPRVMESNLSLNAANKGRTNAEANAIAAQGRAIENQSRPQPIDPAVLEKADYDQMKERYEFMKKAGDKVGAEKVFSDWKARNVWNKDRAAPKPQPLPGAAGVNIGGQQFSEEDIQYTMRKRGMSREQVINRLHQQTAAGGM